MAEGQESRRSSSSPSSSSPAASPGGPSASQAPCTFNFQNPLQAPLPTFPLLFPQMLPGLIAQQSFNQDNHGPGIYAIPIQPFAMPVAGFPPGSLIPLTYKIPTTNSSGSTAGERGLEPRHPHGPQRQIIERRFHFAFQLDLGLILKLAAVVFLFSQEGSRQRVILLVFLALLLYLYQTGALTPLARWIQQGAAPRPRQPVRPDNAVAPDVRNNNQPEGNAGGDGQTHPHPETENLPAADENHPEEPERENAANNFWRIAREIQTFVIGFITSLLPGFHPHND